MIDLFVIRNFRLFTLNLSQLKPSSKDSSTILCIVLNGDSVFNKRASRRLFRMFYVVSRQRNCGSDYPRDDHRRHTYNCTKTMSLGFT